MVLAPRRWRQASWDDPRGDGGNKARSPGNPKEAVKTIAQGRPGETGEPVVTMLVCFVLFRTRGCGCSGHPAFPTPSDFGRAGRHSQTRARCAARSRCCVCTERCLKIEFLATYSARARHTLNRHHPRKRVIQYSRALTFHCWRRGVLDHPLSRVMTIVRCGSNPSEQ